jgi:hypothetical protein
MGCRSARLERSAGRLVNAAAPGTGALSQNSRACRACPRRGWCTACKRRPITSEACELQARPRVPLWTHCRSQPLSLAASFERRKMTSNHSESITRHDNRPCLSPGPPSKPCTSRHSNDTGRDVATSWGLADTSRISIVQVGLDALGAILVQPPHTRDELGFTNRYGRRYPSRPALSRCSRSCSSSIRGTRTSPRCSAQSTGASASGQRPPCRGWCCAVSPSIAAISTRWTRRMNERSPQASRCAHCDRRVLGAALHLAAAAHSGRRRGHRECRGRLAHLTHRTFVGPARPLPRQDRNPPAALGDIQKSCGLESHAFTRLPGKIPPPWQAA